MNSPPWLRMPPNNPFTVGLVGVLSIFALLLLALYPYAWQKTRRAGIVSAGDALNLQVFKNMFILLGSITLVFASFVFLYDPDKQKRAAYDRAVAPFISSMDEYYAIYKMALKNLTGRDVSGYDTGNLRESYPERAYPDAKALPLPQKRNTAKVVYIGCQGAVHSGSQGPKWTWFYDRENTAEATLSRKVGLIAATSPDEAQFLVIHVADMQAQVVVVVDLESKQILGFRKIPTAWETHSELVIPKPGSGVVLVDEKVGPFGIRNVSGPAAEAISVPNIAKTILGLPSEL